MICAYEIINKTNKKYFVKIMECDLYLKDFNDNILYDDVFCTSLK
jgi:hypothetical protein